MNNVSIFTISPKHNGLPSPSVDNIILIVALKIKVFSCRINSNWPGCNI